MSYTHKYTGPTTKYGLRKGSKCRIVGKRAGGKVIKPEGGGTFIVAVTQLEKLK